MRISNCLRQVLQVDKKMLQDICIAVCRQNGNRVKNNFIAVFVAICSQNGDSVKKYITGCLYCGLF